GSILARLSYPQALSPEGEVFHLAVHDREQSGIERPPVAPTKADDPAAGPGVASARHAARGAVNRRRRPGADPAAGRARAGDRHSASARGTKRPSTAGRRAQQVRGPKLRRDRRGHGTEYQGGQVASEPGPFSATRHIDGVPVRGQCLPAPRQPIRGSDRIGVTAVPEPQPLSDADRAELTAYLDGEWAGEDRRRVEARLASDPRLRAEADSLKRAWELLDALPRLAPSNEFTTRTLDRVSALRDAAPSVTKTEAIPPPPR